MSMAAGPLRRLAVGAWPLLHSAGAATVAWVIAHHVIHHHQPFFAPIAAVVALNAALGERGLNTVRLLLGVLVGIATGELALIVPPGGGYATLGLATFIAMAIAQAMHGARIVVAEAAGSAILTVATAKGEVGYQRLADALIGAAVALVFSQLLFAPEPLGLLRRAEAEALAGMAHGLRLTADMIDSGDDRLAGWALDRLREVRDNLSELARTRTASSRVVRHTVIWRTRKAALVRENEIAGHLDLLGGSCLLLTRTAAAVSPTERPRLAPSVHELAGALRALAGRPSDRRTRQHATDRALTAARHLRDIDTGADPALAAAILAARLVSDDITVFADVQPRQGLAGPRSWQW
jgi:uncharacterized membrane protein YgaE (UPF0421/DUF939 family)